MNQTKPALPTDTQGQAAFIRLLVVSVLLFIAGFAITLMALRPSVSTPQVPPDTPTDAPSGSHSPITPEQRTIPGAPPAPASERPPPLPPGDAPEDVHLDGPSTSIKCWDESGIERDTTECDTLSQLDAVFADRLYAVHQCRTDSSGPAAMGTLQVTAEINFAQEEVRFWSEPASTLRNAADVGTCLRQSLTGVPLEGISHQFARYHVSWTVRFAPPVAPPRPVAASTPTIAPSTPSAAPQPQRNAAVTQSRVRVRKEPGTDAEIIGTISAPHEVGLLRQEAEWCQVQTPNQNIGWMICDALNL